MFKILKKAVKLFVFAYIVLLVFRPESAERIIDCDASDGSISVAGNEIPIDGSVIFDTYSGIEERASSLIPSEISKILSDVSEWLSGFFADGSGTEDGSGAEDGRRSG